MSLQSNSGVVCGHIIGGNVHSSVALPSIWVYIPNQDDCRLYKEGNRNNKGQFVEDTIKGDEP